jgi:hypothetical protein
MAVPGKLVAECLEVGFLLKGIWGAQAGLTPIAFALRSLSKLSPSAYGCVQKLAVKYSASAGAAYLSEHFLLRLCRR